MLHWHHQPEAQAQAGVPMDLESGQLKHGHGLSVRGAVPWALSWQIDLLAIIEVLAPASCLIST